MTDGAVLRIRRDMSKGTLPKPEDIEAVLSFVETVRGQKPEKPDYWSSCGQCQNNSDVAIDLCEAPYQPPADLCNVAMDKTGEIHPKSCYACGIGPCLRTEDGL